jgi:hypothetical protein
MRDQSKPWNYSIVRATDGERFYRIQTERGEFIARGAPLGKAFTDAELKSEAALLTAAPELLEALTNCVAWIEMALKHSHPDHANLLQAKAAISKAKGGTQ